MGVIISRVMNHAEHIILTMSGVGVEQRMKEKNLKDKLEAGDKKRAGRLLSTFLREIAQEKTEILSVEGGVPKQVTKARALAAQIWRRALGTYVYIDPVTDATKQPPPDKQMIELIFDRCEGKVGTHDEEVKKDASVPDKVSQANKDKLNKMARKK
ncbi:hypothetical protein LCGC14_0422540 [marine sediment metagenome]|uniref:Uncharacterized protein n=1 Tax=marine sediment metagenome TaxID=412755 RepID=A0A0F9VCB2_9ZZZZ